MKVTEELIQYGIDELMKELGQIVNDIKQLKSTIPADEFIGDARHVSLSAMQTFLVPILFSLQCINFTANNTDREKLGSAFKMPTQKLTYLHDKLTKSTLIVFFHFNIENLFTNILLGLDSNFQGRQFKNITNDLFNSITIVDKNQKKNCIKILSCLRNGFHNNGVHRNADFITNFDGKNFEFVRGEVIKIETFVVIKLLKVILTIVSEIINAPEVLALPTPIVDQMNTKYILPTDDDFLKGEM